MSSIAEGLSYGDDEPAGLEEGDISTTEAFMASLRRDLGEEMPEPVSGDEPPAVPPPPVETGQGVEEPEGDNSDASKGDLPPLNPDWSKEMQELHALLGRQSAELGELRKAVTEPKVEPEEEFIAPTPITDEVVEALEEMVTKSGGENAAIWALSQRPDLYETVLDVWSDSGVPGASRRAAEFNIEYKSQLARYEAEEAAREASEFQAGLAAQLDEQVVALAPSYGLTPGPELDTELAEILSKQPKPIQELLVSKDEGQRAAALSVLFSLAAKPSAITPPEGGAGEALTAALADAKKGASLGTGSMQRQAPATEQTPVPVDGVDVVRLEELLKETPSTSVSDGLTFGR
jgi:hypothetical protein